MEDFSKLNEEKGESLPNLNIKHGKSKKKKQFPSRDYKPDVIPPNWETAQKHYVNFI